MLWDGFRLAFDEELAAFWFLVSRFGKASRFGRRILLILSFGFALVMRSLTEATRTGCFNGFRV